MSHDTPDNFDGPNDELLALAAAACDGTITPDGAARLQSLLRDDPDARRFYVAYVDLHSRLLWRFRDDREAGVAPATEGVPDSVLPGSAIPGSAVPVSPSLMPVAVGSRVRRTKGKSRIRWTPPVLSLLRTANKRMRRLHGDVRYVVALLWICMFLFAGAVAGIVAVVMTMVRGVGSHGDRPEMVKNVPAASAEGPHNDLPRAQMVARLTHAANAVWSNDTKVPAIGGDLSVGQKLVLKLGLAEIKFQNGARAVLQGPAALEVCSHSCIFLTSGKVAITADVPSARGFVVGTPGMKYTDLGTEFGVFVADDGEQEVHVFRGKVAAEEVADESSGMRDAGHAPTPQGVPNVTGSDSHPSSPDSHSPPMVMSADQGLHVAAPAASGTSGRPIVRIAADGKQFVRAAQMDQLVAEQSPEFRRWKKLSDDLSKQPDVLVYYDFQADDADRGILHNRAASRSKLDGRIEGAKWTEGRLPGKQALEFKGRDDRVRVDIPESLEAVTAVVWIRIESLPNPFNSILMSDRWYERIGACHWQIMSDQACVDFEPCHTAKIEPQPAEFRDVVRSPSLARGDFGTWAQLAVAYDSTIGTTTYYKNGQEIGAEKLSKNIPLVFGPSQIANWEPYNSVKPGNAVRNLAARISELYLFSRALSAKEIKRHYDAAVSVSGEPKPATQKESGEVRRK